MISATNAPPTMVPMDNARPRYLREHGIAEHIGYNFTILNAKEARIFNIIGI